MKGKPLAKTGYEQEFSSIKGFVALQNRADSSGASVSSNKVGGVGVCVGGWSVCDVWVECVCDKCVGLCRS